MHENKPKCGKPVDGQKSCIYCNGRCVKNGTAYGKQRYLCRSCKRCFVVVYSYHAYNVQVDDCIKKFVKEGCGIRSVSRLLNISAKTVLSRILKIANTIQRLFLPFGQTYELDELCTYVCRKTNQCWIIYALRRDTKEIVDFRVGNRSNVILKQVTDTLLLSGAKKIYTDKLKQYRTLLPKSLHRTTLHGTNHIERMNLTLRTHLKRLSRRTICYSKSIAMLVACLKIYFWS